MMFHMQQQSNTATTDERFGMAVAELRQAKGLSQRDFAAALEQEGMSVDASAVSRIEKGTRSVRLVEAAAIARALGVGLGVLVREPVKEPVAQLRTLRMQANADLRKLGDEMWGTLIDIWQVVDHLERHPDLFREVEGEPASGAEYLAGITKRLDLWPISDEQVTYFHSDQIPEVEALMARFVKLHLGRVTSAGEVARLVETSNSDGFNENPV